MQGDGDMANMTGKVVVLTGGTDGIGKAAAIAMARLGARLTLMGRHAAKSEAARAEIVTQSGNAEVTVIPGDLASLASVRAFAAAVRERLPRIDVLVNNAGAYQPKRRETVDGNELTFASNQLGPFLLTLELLDTLIASAPARILFTASFAEHFNGVRFDDAQSTRRYAPMTAYAQSKRANLLFAYALARRLQGSGLTVNAWHPGFVRSNIEGNRANPLIRAAAALFTTTPTRAARTLVWLASSPTLDGVTGAYFSNGKRARSSRGSHDVAAQQRLWRLCAELTGAPDTTLAAGS